MSVAPMENPPWGFLQWSLTALLTSLASVGAFFWRLSLRLEKLETTQTRQKIDIEATREAGDGALLRLAEGLALMRDDHFRLRENIGALPTRSDVRDLEDRLAQRLTSLAARLDRALDS